MKDYYIEVFQNGITTTKIKQADSLDQLIENLNKIKLGEMEYQVFSETPYTLENLLYTHHHKSFWK